MSRPLRHKLAKATAEIERLRKLLRDNGIDPDGGEQLQPIPLEPELGFPPEAA